MSEDELERRTRQLAAIESIAESLATIASAVDASRKTLNVEVVIADIYNEAAERLVR